MLELKRKQYYTIWFIWCSYYKRNHSFITTYDYYLLCFLICSSSLCKTMQIVPQIKRLENSSLAISALICRFCQTQLFYISTHFPKKNFSWWAEWLVVGKGNDNQILIQSKLRSCQWCYLSGSWLLLYWSPPELLKIYKVNHTQKQNVTQHYNPMSSTFM